MEGVNNSKPVFREVPLPLGEGAAKRRVRAKDQPSSGPSGHLLPVGEGLAQLQFIFVRYLESEAGVTFSSRISISVLAGSVISCPRPKKLE